MENLIALKKKREIRFFTIEELKKLETKRLLSFYKKERKRFYRFIGGMTCDCCGERLYNIYSDYDNKLDEKIEKEWIEYLKQIKEVLNTREHVKS